jgi:hypothetical protein
MTNAEKTTETRSLPTSAQALQAWAAGNSAGQGFAVGDEDVDYAVDDYDGHIASALASGWRMLRDRENRNTVAIFLNPAGRLVAVGQSNGAWGVYL